MAKRAHNTRSTRRAHRSSSAPAPVQAALRRSERRQDAPVAPETRGSSAPPGQLGDDHSDQELGSQLGSDENDEQVEGGRGLVDFADPFGQGPLFAPKPEDSNSDATEASDDDREYETPAKRRRRRKESTPEDEEQEEVELTAEDSECASGLR